MLRKLTIILFFGLFVLSAQAGESVYPFHTIPLNLLNKAHAVVRESTCSFTVHDIHLATLHVDQTITVLDKKGDEMALLIIPYDKQRKIKNVACQVLNKDGELIRKIKSKEIEDYSNASGSLFEDNRVKYYKFETSQYPYTIRYTYDVEYYGLLHYPVWQPQEAYGIAVEKAVFTVISPKEIAFRYKEINIPHAPAIKEENKQITYRWEVSQLPSLDDEPWGPHLLKIIPMVCTAPNDFKFEGYGGNMSSWEDFGKWILQLNSGRDNLPEKTKQEVQKLVTGLEDREQVIKKLYEYMQSKTRYVSIQLGIGGYQPFDAATVDRLGYGDCKALTNYMMSLLSAANIKSYYTLVKAGKYASDIMTDFPSTQFNHVILCVPGEKDTVWLECTSQTNPLGFLGYFTSDRNVLVIDEQGGHLARTPRYEQSDNVQCRNASVEISANGSGNAQVTTVYTGLRYEYVDHIAKQTVTEQRKLIYAKTSIPSFDLESYQYEPVQGRIPMMKETLRMNLRNYANVSGKRVFFNPNLLNKTDFVPPKVEERKSDIMIRFAYDDVDTITFTIPQELHTEYIPEPVVIKSKFGEYKTEYLVKEGRIIYIRTFKTVSGAHPAHYYDELRNFYEKIAKTDNNSIVLKIGT